MNDRPRSRRWTVWTLWIVALVAVGWFVRSTVRSAVSQLSEQEWHVQPAWLVVAGVLYVLGLASMAWFWRRTLAALGAPVPWSAVLRSYYLGHVGKYVPGKAMAVILRVAGVRKWAPSTRVALASTLLETLTMMSVGAAWAAVLAIAVLRTEWSITALAAAMALACGLPTIPPVARRLSRLGAKGPAALHGFNFRVLLAGWAAATVCWIFLGLSLWAILRAIGVADLDPLGDLPRMIVVTAFSVVAGFIVMLPGGLGVRDLVLTQFLATTENGAANALVAALLMRLVWLVSELAVCVILYVAAKLRPVR